MLLKIIPCHKLQSWQNYETFLGKIYKLFLCSTFAGINKKYIKTFPPPLFFFAQTCQQKNVLHSSFKIVTQKLRKQKR